MFSMVQFSGAEYGGYVYPPWSIGIGWILALISVACIPYGALNSILKSDGQTFLEVCSFYSLSSRMKLISTDNARLGAQKKGCHKKTSTVIEGRKRNT